MSSNFQKLKIPARIKTVSTALFNQLMDTFDSGVNGLSFTTPVKYSASNGLVARPGGTQQRATRLTSELNHVGTVNSDGDSVKLMTALAGLNITIHNMGAKNLAVFPYEADKIDSELVNASVTLLPNEVRMFHAMSDSQWRSTKTSGDVVVSSSSSYDLKTAAPFALLTNGTITISNPRLIIPKGVTGQGTLSPTSGITFISGSSLGLSTSATTDANSLYNELVALSGFTFNDINLETVNVGYGEGSFMPGVYIGSAGIVTAASKTITLIGDGDYVFISQGAMTLGATTKIVLTHGAQAKRVFWVSVGAITTGAVNTLKGNFMTTAAINVGATNDIEGRLLSTMSAEITIDGTSSNVYLP